MLGDSRHNRAWFGAAILGMALLGACSDGTPTNQGTSTTQQAALDAGDASADETEMAVGAMQGPDGALLASLTTTQSSGMSAVVFPHSLCATVSSTTDTDGDGIRDNTTYTYAVPACSFSGWRLGSVDLTGSISISDPDPAPSFAFLLTYDNFKWLYTAPNGVNSWSATRNGTRTLTANASQLTLSNQVSILRTFAHRSDATVAHNTQLVFTPDAGSSLVLGQPLPSGSIAKTGQVTFDRDSVLTFNVNTVVPLRYDATCAVWPRITAGEIHLELTSGGYVKVLWTGCGQVATRTWVE
jgi:hypothetical protein